MRRCLVLLAAVCLHVGDVVAADGLSCALAKQQEAATTSVQEFLWSTAHGEARPDGAIRTRLGLIEPGEGSSTSILLDGVPIALPIEVAGLIRFGKIYDRGDQLALAYLVERPDDSSASPSQVALTLDESGQVTSTDLIPGNADPAPGQCRLIN